MSSELFMLENSFFSDPFSPFADSTIDHQHHDDAICQTMPNSFSETKGLVQESTPLDDNSIYLDQIASFLLSSSPPSNQLENLSLCPATTTHLPNASSSSDSASANGYAELSSLEVKTEEWSVPFDSTNVYGYSNSFVPSPSCTGDLGTAVNNASKLMQRSYSSNSFDNKPDFSFQPCFDSLLESLNFPSQVASSPESSFCSGQMRKVCSTGDLRMMKATPTTNNTLSSSPLSTERSFMEDAANVKVGRYSVEERKERIDRYRAKRTQRNFNKTIKYACRKTLADTRPRIRGRFARNDEAGEIPKTATSHNYRFEKEGDLWIDGFHEEDEDGSYRRANNSFFNSFNSTTQYQYYSY